MWPGTSSELFRFSEVTKIVTQLQSVFILKDNKGIAVGTMDEQISIRFVGERFENARLPLNMIDDLKLFNQMVLEVAGQIYREKHPDVQRLPKGFKSQSLSITKIENGSAIVQLGLPLHGTQTTLVPTDSDECIIEAVDAVSAHLTCSSISKDSSRYEKIISPYCSKFGKGLKEDEKIIFSNGSETFEYTYSTRASLVKELIKYESDIELYCTVEEMDRVKQKFRVSYVNQECSVKTINIPFGSISEDDINEAMMNNNGQRVLITGTGIFTKGDLEEIRVYSFDLLDPRDVQARIDDLLSLKDNWYEGQGKRLDRASAKLFADSFDMNNPLPDNLPRIYPTPEGGLELEWEKPNITMYVSLPDFKAELILLDSEEEEVKELDLKSEENWKKLQNYLRGEADG